jgi:uncharacterized membrane protein YeaQ/YmgE (transglycosylase-associated protein family)
MRFFLASFSGKPIALPIRTRCYRDRRGRRENAKEKHSMLHAIIIGLIAGWLTGKLINGHGYGVVTDILLGLVGGVIGAVLFHAAGIHPYNFIGYLMVSTVGASSLVIVTRILLGEV